MEENKILCFSTFKTIFLCFFEQVSPHFHFSLGPTQALLTFILSFPFVAINKHLFYQDICSSIPFALLPSYSSLYSVHVSLIIVDYHNY